MSTVLFAGLDVDDQAYHAAVVDPLTEKIIELKVKPTAAALAQRLKAVAKGKTLKICYESTYLGFSLQRQLSSLGISCEVVASSLIPGTTGKRQKNDRIDARKLAVLYMKGLLTPVQIPDAETEADRDLLRSRLFAVRQLTKLKNHTSHLCRRAGWNYRGDTGGKSLWTKDYMDWINAKASNAASASLRINLRILLQQIDQLSRHIATYDSEIEAMSEKERYKKQVAALICYRGIERGTALTLITELGDINRFRHPRQIVGYAGLDVVEHSSGGRERRFGISKTGNPILRTALVEANQFSLVRPTIGRRLLQRREGIDARFVAIADRCMDRLHKKGTRLLYRDKGVNRTKVACAREMLGFIWESLRAASA